MKAYALETPGVCNAACEFDIKTLSPTFKLIIGAPGKSNAFAIASRLGLKENVISRAGSLISEDNKRFENVIEKLESDGRNVKLPFKNFEIVTLKFVL